MDEQKATKISLSTFFLILAIIIIIGMGTLICILYKEKTELNQKSAELQTQVNNLTATIAKNINTNTSIANTDNNDSTFFTDEQVKATLSNFLELQAHANCDSLLENLTEKGFLNYDSSKDTIQNDGTIITKIKFSDYKNAMLNYISESEFERNWSSTQYFSENTNGYLSKIQGGGGLRTYTINNLIKNNNSTYSAKTTSIVDNDTTTKENEDFTFTVKDYHGNCVINSIN